MTPSITLPRRELRPGTKRYSDGDNAPAWDVYLDDRQIASEYVALADARMELDFALWYALFGEAALHADALITDEALGLAMQVFNRMFSAEKILDKALTARDKIIGAGIYTIQTDGTLNVLASSGRGTQSNYIVTTTCTCKDFFTHAHRRGGVCKHIAARMLLVLAQYGVGYLKHLRDALDTRPVVIHGLSPITPSPAIVPTPADAPALAYLSIAAADLAAALFLVLRAGTPIDIHLNNGALRLLAGAIDLALAGADGSDSCSVQLTADALSALYQELRPVTRGLSLLTLFAAQDGSLIIDSPDTDFSVTAQGRALALPAADLLSRPQLAHAA
jgi:hypothetical protein